MKCCAADTGPMGQRNRCSLGPGSALHHYVLPAMAAAANVGLPAAYLNVYGAAQIIVLALAGLVIAVAGALLPAGWAAKTGTASALRTE